MSEPLSQESPAEPVPAVRVGAAPTIRVANKALILRGDEMLVNVCLDLTDSIEFHMVPGGGQEWGEDAVTALRRECREEIGCDVVVGPLAFVRDYVGANHRFAAFDAWFHQQENYFLCTIVEGQEPRFDPATGDERQTGVAWKKLSELEGGEFAPQALFDWLRLPEAERPGYLGDVI